MTTVLITGANRGIGLALTSLYLGRGDTVIAVCRSRSAGLDGTAAEVEDGVDVTDADGLSALAKRLEGRRIDVLINNAGILTNESFDDLDLERIRKQFEVNALGPLRVVKALRPNLGAGSKVGIVTSRMGSIADNTSGGRYGYRISKAAVNMAGKSLAHDLAGAGIAVALLHPGFVRTEMTGLNGYSEPGEAAAGLAERLDALTLESSGSFWHANGEALPW